MTQPMFEAELKPVNDRLAGHAKDGTKNLMFYPALRIVSGIGICYTKANCRCKSIGTTIRNIHEF
ncbi:MAG: hypothetical protein IKK82_12870 [Kiritimatiellae bacterium]|nr:hypothetical protein [Kiritimatiellia bacterium]